jgi:hypothetical protein
MSGRDAAEHTNCWYFLTSVRVFQPHATTVAAPANLNIVPIAIPRGWMPRADRSTWSRTHAMHSRNVSRLLRVSLPFVETEMYREHILATIALLVEVSNCRAGQLAPVPDSALTEWVTR